MHLNLSLRGLKGGGGGGSLRPTRQARLSPPTLGKKKVAVGDLAEPLLRLRPRVLPLRLSFDFLLVSFLRVSGAVLDIGFVYYFLLRWVTFCCCRWPSPRAQFRPMLPTLIWCGTRRCF